jgi:hypothetical protein
MRVRALPANQINPPTSRRTIASPGLPTRKDPIDRQIHARIQAGAVGVVFNIVGEAQLAANSLIEKSG